ncbi:TPA: cbb3-type cytochrome c oxidase subunit I [Staphylococcus aureus]|uniref:Nitric oxide reductase n=3 Tax=Staphylococcus aureus TaxID=1280 RepID=A0A2S6DST3_STAAU|nr:cbb3-type cytochrome c oxidase subunit I [Staphylococcus aureus]HDH6225214.1 cbb3-type cytochrome c oxidase subunit I [Staphylococcus aureus LTCF-12-46]HDH6264314.1 cbb3-type cytochrome c oxidase subunit I [Staphylococcus aureus LTCF-7-30]HDH6420668.1 cbb3-type cytochrome c oxidase subunit I [Staphylococcus aureus MRSA-Lux-33]HDH6423207.1 cbb3-type cytochrome c oxidase subunit I [Staphylococcus aureus MRSA-Lux-34]HDH6425906.1 cbb3-type cytochrome c oxidase subunit I [Staphylococcus aureus M
MSMQSSYKRLVKVLLTILVIVFSILLVGGWYIFKNEAPRPTKIVDQQGHTLVTKGELISGQAIYEKYGLTDYGSYLGNGSYLGPDYTAEALHHYLIGMRKYYAQDIYHKQLHKLNHVEIAVVKDKVMKEIRINRYSEKEDQLVLTPGQVYGLKYLQDYYKKEFVNNPKQVGLNENMIKQFQNDDYMVAGNKIEHLSQFFFWGAWLSSTDRPGKTFSYTNNWPYDVDAGNTLPSAGILWTAISVTLLIAGLAFIIYIQKRYEFDMKPTYESERELPKIEVDSKITDSQRKVGKYLVVVMLLFLVQILLGELLAHYYVENKFFGIEIQRLFPFNIVKTWHVQLVIFWVATTWLAAGIYIVPKVLGNEPKKQGVLVDILFWALIIVVMGSMIGEWSHILGWIDSHWWLFGHFGWEYIELGKFWQILFIVGMVLWVIILCRGFLPAIRNKVQVNHDKRHLLTLLFVGAIAIPLFYLASLFIMPNSHVTFADYWRWWIVHLWVEGIFEAFAVVLIGFLMVNMKLTTIETTIRALYFQLILLLGTGIVGMGHHYYWQGDHSIWLALGSCFSALEVVPLCLLIWEAYTHYRLYKKSDIAFPYKGTFIFLASTGLWNAIGAGALGFLINTPAVNYFEHGTQWTAAHAHGSMAGVYGMFSIAIALYVFKNITKKEFWTPKVEKWIKISCWALNVGLAGMVFVTLIPVGYIQLKDGLEDGYWHSRLTSFYEQPLVKAIMWGRMPWDIIFTVGVIILVVIFIRGYRHLKPKYRV